MDNQKTTRPKNEFAAEVLKAPVMVTPGAMEAFTRAEIGKAMSRHLELDWRDMDAEDRKANLRAAMEGGARVMSAFRLKATDKEPCDIWIITEADRSSTTVLLPSEY